ncbi:hypothetical protein BHM03_00031181, partial [Ensete ventricosum]
PSVVMVFPSGMQWGLSIMIIIIREPLWLFHNKLNCVLCDRSDGRTATLFWDCDVAACSAAHVLAVLRRTEEPLRSERTYRWWAPLSPRRQRLDAMETDELVAVTEEREGKGRCGEGVGWGGVTSGVCCFLEPNSRAEAT